MNRPSPAGLRAGVRLLVGCVLALALALGRTPSASAAEDFSDVPPGTAFHTEISWMRDQGISTGWTDNGTATFRPLEPVNHDAMAAFLYRLAGRPAFTPPTTSPFSDVLPTTAFYAEITWAAARGITTGWPEADGSRTFRPLRPIARDAMAAFLYRFAGSPAYAAPDVPQFFDISDADQFHAEVSWLGEEGITTGWPEPGGCPTFRPLQPIARDAIAAFLYRHENGGVPVPPNTCEADWSGTDWEVLPTTWPVVALTFDGGASDAGVQRILDTLSAEGVPATFFVTGQFARTYPASVRAMAAAGHPVGNHSDTHPPFTSLTETQIRDQLADAEGSIEPLVGTTTPLFRYPSGDRSAATTAIVNNEGYVPFRWTVDSLGWQGTVLGHSAASVCQRVVAAARPGEIALMHVGAHPVDGSLLDADALGCIIDGFRDRGYGFVTLRQFIR